MNGENEETREERKRKFIAVLKEKRCRELIEPLARKIESYKKGKTAAEDVFKSAYHVSREGKEIETMFKKRPDVILAGIAMEENKYITEIGGITVKVRQGDLTALFVDAIINPANPEGEMAAGIAGAIKRAGGDQIEKEAVSKAPITPGQAISTGAGSLPNLYVIHAPTIDRAEAQSSPEKVGSAFSAALSLAGELKCETLAATGMGTGTGGVAPEESAEAMLGAITAHDAKTVSDIILIDRDEEMVGAFIRALERYDEENE
jgi:O-acetyl-ADP-ribose deacetylase (regulator of RNase III)